MAWSLDEAGPSVAMILVSRLTVGIRVTSARYASFRAD